jgi:DNA repair protein RadC
MIKDAKCITVKELPVTERPYEKCELYGAEALTDTELLAVILRTGRKGERSTDLARRILMFPDDSGNITSLDHLSIDELKQINGVGRVKAIQIKCAAELGRRIAAGQRREVLNAFDPQSVAGYYRYKIGHLEKETVMLLHADSKGRIFYEERLSVGTVDCSLVSPREIFVSALAKKSVNIFLLHNHPSGDPTPSHEDCLVTERVAEAGKLIGIKLLDHIIIGDRSYVSFRELGISCCCSAEK